MLGYLVVNSQTNQILFYETERRMEMSHFLVLLSLKVRTAASSLVTLLTKKVTLKGVGFAILGGIGSLAGAELALSALISYLFGPPKPTVPRELRLAHILTAQEITETTLAEKEQTYVDRLDRIGRLLENITSGRVKGAMQDRLRNTLEKTVKTQQETLKQFPRLKLTLAVLEEARRKLQDNNGQ